MILDIKKLSVFGKKYKWWHMQNLDNILDFVLTELDKKQEQPKIEELSSILKNNTGNIIYSLKEFQKKEYKIEIDTFHPIIISDKKIIFFGIITTMEFKTIFPISNLQSIVSESKNIKIISTNDNLYSEVMISEVTLFDEISQRAVDDLFSFLCIQIGLSNDDSFNNKNDFSKFLKYWVTYQKNILDANRKVVA